MKIKKTMAYITLIVILLISGLSNLGLTLTSKSQNNVLNKSISQQDITINKTVTGEGPFEITLDVKATQEPSQPQNADIVIIIDESASMSDKISEVKTATKNFIQNILSKSSDDLVRIAVGTFSSTYIGGATPGRSSEVVTDFTSDINTLNQGIDSISISTIAKTHTQDGIYRAKYLLDTSRTDAKKYVLFFTDGYPTVSYSRPSGIDYENPSDEYFREAQKEYYKYFVGYNYPTTVEIGGIGENPQSETITVDPDNAIYKDVKFYSVGLFTDDINDKEKAINFLKTLQNVIEPSQYSDNYYTESLNAIDAIFMEISKDINLDIENSIVSDVVINDIVTKEFSMIANSCKVTDLNGEEIGISSENIIENKNENGEDEITINIGDIKFNSIDENGNEVGGVKITFLIEAKDPYFSGENIYTNVGAYITYKDPEDDTEYTQEFNKPTVNIQPQKGSITIIKEIVYKNNEGNWIKVDDSKVNINDRFSIYIVGNEKYTVDLIGNEQTTMNFYLKQDTTDISNNEDTSINYISAGEYQVEEIVPMNYEKIQVLINKSTNESEAIWEDISNGFTIDKDNKNITIKITNTLVNNNFFYDKSDVINELKYNPIQN